jgi:hypothetical protein
MATLRAFQSEIEDIQAKKSAEQQRQTSAATAVGSDKKGKAKDASNGSANANTAAPTSPVVEIPEHSDDEDLARVQVCSSYQEMAAIA